MSSGALAESIKYGTQLAEQKTVTAVTDGRYSYLMWLLAQLPTAWM